MIVDLIPFKTVGEFQIGSNIENYIKKYNFNIYDYSNDSTPGINFSLTNPKITLFVYEEIIESIACYEKLVFKKKNLIGMSLVQFIEHTGENYVGLIDELDFEDNEPPQYVYEFEGIGLQVWIKNEIIVTIIVSNQLL